MMRLILFNFVFLPLVLLSQAPTISWEKSIGGTGYDYAWSVIETSDQGYLFTGMTASSDGDLSGSHPMGDVLLVKLDINGAISWVKTFGGFDQDQGRKVIETSDGGYVIAGATASVSGDVTMNQGLIDAWLIKVDQTGNLVWQKTFGGSAYDYFDDLIQLSNGNIVAVGYTSSTDGDVSGNHGVDDVWVVSVTAQGSLNWTKTFGSSGPNLGHAIESTSDGGVIVAGSALIADGDVSSTNGSGYADGWLIKLDASGVVLWEKTYGGTNHDSFSDIISTVEGGYLVVGESRSSDVDVAENQGSEDFWVVKVSSTGSILWQKSYGGDGTDKAKSVIELSSGGYVIAGEYGSLTGDASSNNGWVDYWVLKLDLNGELVWEKNLGGSIEDRAHDVVQTNDGGVIIVGDSQSNDGDITNPKGWGDCWIVKLNGVVGISLESIQPFLLYPNPVKEVLTLKANEVLNGSYSIVDVNGRVLITGELNEAETIIPVPTLKPGTYFIYFEQYSSVLKFVKE
ncbi:MAG: T9SS type A sorting domain-containing protein [Bacteroidetes bacterium]|nr:MAG: T9SS type A sorting domain-containing protein [Bacteroidota bacterium]